MIALFLYYIVLPMLAAWALMKFLKAYAPSPVPESVRRQVAEDPVERKWYRALEVSGRLGSGQERLAKLGDFDAQDKAVDAAYHRRGERPEAGVSWLVLNDKGEILQEVV